MKKSDWVRTKDESMVIGYVERVARDGSWADVNWKTHVKRMPVESLVVLHTIAVGDWEITDYTRKKELEDEILHRTAPVTGDALPAAPLQRADRRRLQRRRQNTGIVEK